MNKFYLVSNKQIFVCSILISVIVFSLLTINTLLIDFLQLPKVVISADNKCITVINFKNGENYSCADVDIILRNYRVKTHG